MIKLNNTIHPKGLMSLIIIYTDGASEGNPGRSSAGVVINHNGEVSEYSFSLGIMSNHEAEFWAVIYALDVCLKKFPGEILSFRTDSKIVVDTIEKDYTKNDKFLPLLEEIKERVQHFPYMFIKWIPTVQNKHADQLAKRALNESPS